MKKILHILLFLPFWVQSQSVILGGTVTSYPPINWVGHTTVFFGDSWVLGVAASPMATNRFTTLFCAAKNTTENNNGVSGQSLQTNACGGSTFAKTLIPAYNSSIHACLFLEDGLNDVGLNQGTMLPSVFQTTLDDAVNYAINTKGWPPLLVILITPGWLVNYAGFNGIGGCTITPADATRQAAYVTAVKTVASAYGCRVVDLYQYTHDNLTTPDFAPDGLHPNNTGHSLIASFLISQIN